MAARTWSALVDSNWSDPLAWDGGLSVPATTDSITFNSTSVKNCTIDALGTWSDGSFTVASTYSGTITQNTGINITTSSFSQAAGTITCHAAATFESGTFTVSGGTFNQGGAFVSTTFSVSGGTWTGGSATCSTSTLSSTGSTVRSVTLTSGIWTVTGNVTLTGSNLTFSANGGTIALTGSLCTWSTSAATLNLVTVNKTSSLTVSTGTLPLGASPSTNTNSSFTVSSGATVSVSGAWTHGGALFVNSGGIVSGALTSVAIATSNFRVNAAATWPTGVDVTITMTGPNSRDFSMGGQTYGAFARVGTGTGTTTLNDGGTVTSFTDTGSAAHTLALESGITINCSSFVCSGSVGNIITINAVTPGAAATFHTTGGIVSVNYLSIQDNTVDASPKWYAGDNSTNVSGNTNWLFTSPTVDVTAEFVYPSRGTRRSTGPAILRLSRWPYVIANDLAPITDTNFILPTYPQSTTTGPTVARRRRRPYLFWSELAPVTNTRFVFPTYPRSLTTGPMSLRDIPQYRPYDNQAPVTNTEYVFPSYPESRWIGPAPLRLRQAALIWDDQAPLKNTEYIFASDPPHCFVGPMALRVGWRRITPTDNTVAPTVNFTFVMPTYPHGAGRWVGPAVFWSPVRPGVPDMQTHAPTVNYEFVYPTYQRNKRKVGPPAIFAAAHATFKPYGITSRAAKATYYATKGRYNN